MKRIHLLLLRRLPGPFLGWLGTLLFLLLLQFLIKFLPELAGRSLPLGLVAELIAYNLAYMVVLAVPMATLLASLMAFGAFAESRTWVVIRNCGITFWQLAWPALVASVLLAWLMVYFNNVLLPESNFRARNLWQDVRAKRPGFELQPGIFYEGLDEYSILVRHRTGNELEDILIYDYTRAGPKGITLKATRGELIPWGESVNLLMWDGEVHRLSRTAADERYERITFDRFLMRLDLSEFNFQRGNPAEGFRSDRSTPTQDMVRIVDSLKTGVDKWRADLQSTAPLEYPGGVLEGASWPKQRPALDGLVREDSRRVYRLAQDAARSGRSKATSLQRSIERESATIRGYQVEIHKKYSIAVACVIFMVVGGPLGLSIRRGGLGRAGALSLAVFLFYWVTLVQGEKLADRALLAPWLGMWIANIVIGAVGVWLCIRVAQDLHSRPPIWRR